MSVLFSYRIVFLLPRVLFTKKLLLREGVSLSSWEPIDFDSDAFCCDVIGPGSHEGRMVNESVLALTKRFSCHCFNKASTIPPVADFSRFSPFWVAVSMPLWKFPHSHKFINVFSSFFICSDWLTDSWFHLFVVKALVWCCTMKWTITECPVSLFRRILTEILFFTFWVSSAMVMTTAMSVVNQHEQCPHFPGETLASEVDHRVRANQCGFTNVTISCDKRCFWIKQKHPNCLKSGLNFSCCNATDALKEFKWKLWHQPRLTPLPRQKLETYNSLLTGPSSHLHCWNWNWMSVAWHGFDGSNVNPIAYLWSKEDALASILQLNWPC